MSNRIRWVARTLASGLAVCCAVLTLAAQSPSPRVIQCGTTASFQSKCNTDGYATGVRLVRDLSGDKCRQNSTWGFTDAFVWTQEKCRGEFEITYRNTSPSPIPLPTPTPTPVPSTRMITCGTTSGAQVQCNTGGYATSVRLVRDRSGNRCRQNSNWGHTDSFIWANKGCYADFEVTYGGTTPAPPLGAGTRIITCGTTSHTQVECKTGGYATDVRLVREHSRNRCRQNKSWGHTDSFIWANKGCRADFEVTYAGTTPTPLPRPIPGPGPAPGTRTISCGNRAGVTMSCDAFGTVASVRMLQDQSGGRCRQGFSWGYDQSSVWVKNGCWADFEVRYTGVPQRR